MTGKNSNKNICKQQTSLSINAIWSENFLFAYNKYGSQGIYGKIKAQLKCTDSQTNLRHRFLQIHVRKVHFIEMRLT